MTLMPDDDPELSLSAAVIPSEENFLPALTGDDAPVSPARVYLLSLNSPRSRQTMASFLNIVAGMLRSVSLDACSSVTAGVTNGAKVIHIRRLKSDPGVNLLS
ncbi:hypothetical protein GVv1_47850 (plasmid) [Enterobacter pseudoroggenkampii]